MLLTMSGFVAACAGGPRPSSVTPAEIPTLKAQAAQQPTNAQVRFRLAAALLAAGGCDTAVVVANSAQVLAPGDVLGPMVIGKCQEQDGRPDLAYATYADFARRYPKARGIAGVHALADLALRAQATQTAKLALARESTVTTLAPEPSTIAVLPVTIAGDSGLQPLSRGLAELITTDLAYVRNLRLLERVQVGALLDELNLGASGRADPATAARVGRLLRAERMVQGVAAITENGPVRMSATIVRGDGEVRAGARAEGTFKQLLDLEKQLVFSIATQLGIQVTEAERQQILRQGPKNLAAFLAYSEGTRSDGSRGLSWGGRGIQCRGPCRSVLLRGTAAAAGGGSVAGGAGIGGRPHVVRRGSRASHAAGGARIARGLAASDDRCLADHR